MSIDAVPTKQANSPSPLSALSTLSSGSKGLNGASSSFENYLAEARTAPVQTQSSKERGGNTSKAVDRETSANNSEPDRDAVDSARTNGDSAADATPASTESQASAATPVAPATPGSQSASELPGGLDPANAADSAATTEVQDLLAAQAAALAATSALLATTATATLAPNASIPALAQELTDSSRFAELSSLTGADRRLFKKELASKGQDNHIDSKIRDATSDRTQDADAPPATDNLKATAPSKFSKGKDAIDGGIPVLERAPDSIKSKPGERDFASLLGSATASPLAVRQQAEPISITSMPNLNAQPRFEVSSPLDSPRFVSSLAGHLSTIISQSVDRAEIQLNPRELGPIRVELTIKDREAQVTLIATEARTVQAIEQSSNMLRTLLTDQGLSLGQFEVRSGSSGSDRPANQQAGQSPDGQPQSRNQGSGTDHVTSPDLAGLQAVQRSSLRLLDLFA